MQDWLKQQIDTGFGAFQGARLSGSIPLREALINELLAEALRAAQAPDRAPAQRPPVDVARLAAMVSSARVEVGDGRVTVHFELNA
jgi:hypothetical protein